MVKDVMFKTLTEAVDPYKELGYTDRNTYLRSLAVDFGIDEANVFALAELLGPAEDFDGLISDLEDFSQFL